MGKITFLILGGYGGTGKLICRKLLKEFGISIVIAGRSIQKANELCSDLKSVIPFRWKKCMHCQK
ncbi:MAG: hypothetical protein K2Q21_02675 [Chitinophagaceae bacterium]|nr:hypothetical protein [Chitinophagaceae bacterium]